MVEDKKSKLGNICVILNYPLHKQIEVGHLDILKIQFENMLEMFEEVHVVSPRDKNEYDLKNEKIIVHPLPPSNPLFYYMSPIVNILFALYLVKKEKISIIRAMAPTSGFEAVVISKLLKIPTVVSIHANRKLVEKIEGKRWLKSKLLDILEPWILKNASLVPVISEYIMEYVTKMGTPKSKIFLHPNFVDTELFKPGTKINKNKVELVFVGRLTPVKGADIAIRALSIIKDKNVVLKIIGSGEQRDELKKLSKELKIDDRVIFYGRVEHENELPKILQESDIFVAPLTAGFSLIEAMACGLPIVAGDIEWTREIIKNGETGILVRPNDPYALAEGIIKLIKNKKLRNSMAKECRRVALRKFSIDAWKKRELEIYRIALKGEKV